MKSTAANTGLMPPWQPGQSGNPAGRPRKEQTLTDILRSKVDPDRLADALLDRAYDGDIPALREVYSRVDGAEIGTVIIAFAAQRLGLTPQDVLEAARTVDAEWLVLPTEQPAQPAPS